MTGLTFPGDLDATEARALIDGMRRDVADLGERITTAYLGRAWIALGYPSWDRLCEAEFDGARLRLPREDRAEQVQSLRSAGLSTRAIGSALGVDPSTVRADLASAGNPPVETVQSLDGRTRPATQPARPAVHVTTTEKTVEEFIADRDTGEVLSVEDWQKQEETRALDDDLEQQLAGTDDRFLLNLARALAACNGLLRLSPQRAIETCAPGSDDHAALMGFVQSMDGWLNAVRRPTASHLRSVR